MWELKEAPETRRGTQDHSNQAADDLGAESCHPLTSPATLSPFSVYLPPYPAPKNLSGSQATREISKGTLDSCLEEKETLSGERG